MKTLKRIYNLIRALWWEFINTPVFKKPNSVKKSDWYAVKKCKNCHETVNNDQIYFNDCICAYCGVKTGRYLLSHYTLSVREVTTREGGVKTVTHEVRKDSK